jgi:alpha-glucosidase/alpha-D-xyloside xylohydrolase
VARGDQYLYGRDFLVAPVVEKGATSRKLYLPRGLWHDYWTGAQHQGGNEITRDVDLATLPLYVRAGAVIPSGPVKQYTAEAVDEPLTLTVYPGADGSSFLYQDDGETFNFRKGEFTRIEIRWNDAARRLDLHLGKNARMLDARGVRLKIGIAGKEPAETTVFRGQPLSIKLT